LGVQLFASHKNGIPASPDISLVCLFALVLVSFTHFEQEESAAAE
jgi:hypothetical protein